MNVALRAVRACESIKVAIVGAGPYGLAAAAHLRAANVPIRVFGDALSFWRQNMPTGMKLRSPWAATHIAAPHGRYRLDDYFGEADLAIPKLLPVEQFIDYGRWFRQRVAPDLDTRAVTRVDAYEGGFRLMLDDGSEFRAHRVVMATGLLGHEFRPGEFTGLPRELVFHSCEHTASEPYRGRRVAVIGRGQSACESAALLHEAGAEVEIICRGTLIWNADPAQRSMLRQTVRSLLGDKLIPPSQVGPFPCNWVNEVPGVIQYFPQDMRDRWNEKNLRASAILWLRPRLSDVPVDQCCSIRAARRDGVGVELTLDNGRKRFDHVLLATGYRIEVDKMTSLAPELRDRIARHAGLPVLSGSFESSVPGLHFIGAAAVGSFGPLLRFIAGAGFAARRLTRHAQRTMTADRVVDAPSIALATHK